MGASLAGAYPSLSRGLDRGSWFRRGGDRASSIDLIAIVVKDEHANGGGEVGKFSLVIDVSKDFMHGFAAFFSNFSQAFPELVFKTHACLVTSNNNRVFLDDKGLHGPVHARNGTHGVQDGSILKVPPISNLVPHILLIERYVMDE